MVRTLVVSLMLSGSAIAAMNRAEVPAPAPSTTPIVVVTPTYPYPFGAEIHEYAAHFNVPVSLVLAVIRQESDFNPKAVSPAGARGLMQLMPDTARQLQVRNSFNPRENIRGGVQHLRYLLDRYNGNTTLAVAAYNAGEEAVNRYRGVPPYEETQGYVRAVKQYTLVYNGAGPLRQ